MTNDYPTLRPETRTLISGSESRDVEFKQSLAGLESSDLVAFANVEGGVIFIGVREEIDSTGMKHGIIVGQVGDDERIRGSIISKATSCRPPVNVTVSRELDAGNYIYRIDIKKATVKPCCTSGGRYVTRDDGATKPIDPSTMTALILERESDNFVARLEHAGNALIEELKKGQLELSSQIARVEKAAEAATTAADQARWAADEAKDAALNAAAMAEEAAFGG